MKSVFFLSSLVVLSAAVPFNGKDGTFSDGIICGGTPTDITRIPWQISLEFYGSRICGGSIISPGWVVTSAHCIDGVTISQLVVRAGTSVSGSGGQTVNIRSIHQHPQYNEMTLDWDIAVLELNSQLSFDLNVDAVDLPQSGASWPEGTDAFVSGWGITCEDTTDLMGANVQIVSSENCSGSYGAGSITPRMLCVGGDGNGNAPCQGDSGSPLVVGSTLAGIVSWAMGCAQPDYPGVYSDVGILRNYITQITGL